MSIDEKKTAGASYIIEFYQNIIAINNAYSNYNNACLQLAKVQESLTDLQKEQFNSVLHNTRYLCHNIYIMFASMKSYLKIDQTIENALEKDYNKIRDTYVIETTVLFNFIVGINKVLLSDVVKNLLENSQDIIDKVFNGNDNVDK